MCVKTQVDASSAAEAGKKKKRRSSSSVGGRRRSQYDVRMVDEITDDDLENVAYRSKDKIWDKENVGGPPAPPHPPPPLPRCFSPPSSPLLPPLRAARATSAGRRLWTLRPFAAAASASGPKVNSADRA